MDGVCIFIFESTLVRGLDVAPCGSADRLAELGLGSAKLE